MRSVRLVSAQLKFPALGCGQRLGWPRIWLLVRTGMKYRLLFSSLFMADLKFGVNISRICRPNKAPLQVSFSFESLPCKQNADSLEDL